jgi:methylmalonyl-CoA mutase cobalamin-binding subunit
MEILENLDIRKELVKKIQERLLLGADRYGGPIPINDDRDFLQEALEEVLDATIYLTATLIQIKHGINNDKKRN